MRRPMPVAAAVTAVLSLALVVSPVAAVTNGWNDDGDHPNVGILYMDNLPALAYGFCSGSLLSEDEFLVAGHCTAALSAYLAAELITENDVFVSFDEQFTVDGDGVIHTTTKVGVTGWVTNPSLVYSGGLLRNDVGVIHLATPQSQEPIELPELGLLDSARADGDLRGHDFVTVGYGLNSIDRSVLSPQAASEWDHHRMVAESTYVALSSNNLLLDGGACSGDSGGPYFWADDSDLVVAVTSSGSPVCSFNAAQRIDIEPVLGFLEQYD